MGRTLLLLLVAAATSACGGEPPAPLPPSAPVVDRSPADRPAGTLAELTFDGGDAALSALIAQLPPTPMRAALPNRVATLLDGLIETPSEIRSRVSSGSPIRLVMARIDGELRSALVVRLDEPVPTSSHRGDGPRGSDRVGEHAAVDDRIAVVSDDGTMLDRSFAYLAYTALARASTEGEIVVIAPASTVATTVRTGLEQMVRDRRGSLLASVAAARAAHDRPPDLGDPEALVTLLADALLARLAYLPDLGDATLTLARTPSGLALTIEASVTQGSPLADALSMRRPVASRLVSAMPSSAALVIATGTTAAARTATEGELAETLAAIGGARVTASERMGLEQASGAIAAIRGDEAAFGLGATETDGILALTLTRGGTDTAAPMPWGRAFPWTSQLLATLAGCTATSARPSATAPVVCNDVSLATRAGDGARADAIGRNAAALAESAHASLAADTPASSPDLARDLAALPSAVFAIVLARPLRALPLLVALGGPPRAGLPRGDGAIVLAFAYDAARLSIVLRASSSAMADLAVVQGLFAEESESE